MMNIKSLLALALCAIIPMAVSAKKPKVEEVAPVVEETPTLSDEDCAMKLSLMSESVKNKQYADAYEPWWELYTLRPEFNKAIYTQGSKIIEWKLANATSDEERLKWRSILMESFDKRIQYFGGDKKYPTDYILGEKGLSYIENYPEDSIKADAHSWLKQSVNALTTTSKISVLTALFETSYSMYKSNPDKYSEGFMADYTQVSTILQQIAVDPASKNASTAAQQKEYVDNLFAVSGAADCGKLDELYANYVQPNSTLEELLKVMKLYRRVSCTESEIYFAAAEAAHKLQPTEESAVACASMCKKKENWNDAINYYYEALRLMDDDSDPNDKADYFYNVALIAMDKLKNYTLARTSANLSLEANPNQGRCYILIGLCYAASHPYDAKVIGEAKAAILNKAVFWAAVDKFQKAKQVDPTCVEAANQMIASYSKYFPTREEMFDLPNEFGGEVFIVGGWINERTVCRAAK